MSQPETRDREVEHYPNVLRAVRETAWAIMPETLLTIREVLALRMSGERFSPEEIQARVGNRNGGQRAFQMVGSVAVLPIYGVLIPRADAFTEMSGGTSVQRMQETFREAVDDEGVSAIVFDVESPGGSSDLIPEFAAQIRAARGSKPIVAVANTRAGSAAYYLAAQADELVVTKSGDVGSIGVFAIHEDISKALEAEGVKVTEVSAGKFKTETSPFKPLSPEAEAAIQERIDEIYGMFVADVAKGRRVSVETVRNDFGQGRMVTAANAVKLGMADRVDTLEATVQRLSKGRAHAPVQEPDPVQPDDLGATATTAPTAHGQTITVSITGDPTNLGANTTGPTFTDTVDEALGAFEAVVSGAEALRALTGTKRAQLSALIERGTQLLAASASEDEAADEGLELEHQLVGHAARLRR